MIENALLVWFGRAWLGLAGLGWAWLSLPLMPLMPFLKSRACGRRFEWL